MQDVGDAVMAVFGAPFAQHDHADRALRSAEAMHQRQARVDATWSARGLERFGLGIGSSSGEVAAALLGSDERLEYTVVGDTVSLAQRLQELARPEGVTVLSDATVSMLSAVPPLEQLPPQTVKGREREVVVHRISHLPERQPEHVEVSQ